MSARSDVAGLQKHFHAPDWDMGEVAGRPLDLVPDSQVLFGTDGRSARSMSMSTDWRVPARRRRPAGSRVTPRRGRSALGRGATTA
jgi:hypothetical protein